MAHPATGKPENSQYQCHFQVTHFLSPCFLNTSRLATGLLVLEIVTLVGGAEIHVPKANVRPEIWFVRCRFFLCCVRPRFASLQGVFDKSSLRARPRACVCACRLPRRLAALLCGWARIHSKGNQPSATRIWAFGYPFPSARLLKPSNPTQK